MKPFTQPEISAFVAQHFTGENCNHCALTFPEGDTRRAYHLATVHNMTAQRIALIVQDTLSEALGQGKRYTVCVSGTPDGERKTFKAAQALAKQRGATHFVITANSYEIKATDTRHKL